jgi:hypothetical protein
MVSTAIVVEGVSDEMAVRTLAARRGIDLAARDIEVVPLGGVTNVAKALFALRPTGIRMAGLCDAGEVRYFRQALERAGFGDNLDREDMAALGFFVCDADLEDELIASLGAERVEEILDAEGDLKSFRTFQNQPFQRERDIRSQLRRFFGTTSGRKAHYARALVDGLDLDTVPRPLDGLLRFVNG